MPATLGAALPAEQADVFSTMLMVSTPSPSVAAEPGVHAVGGEIMHLPESDVQTERVRPVGFLGILRPQLSFFDSVISTCRLT